MVGLFELSRGIELIQHTTIAHLSDLFRIRASIQSSPSNSLRLKASQEGQDVLRIHVLSLKGLTQKVKSLNVLVKLTLIGNNEWYCEGTTREQALESGSCTWNECIEFSRISEYTYVKVRIGCYKRFRRFKILANTCLRLSAVAKLNNTQWFTLYKEKKQKYKCALIKLSFESSTASPPGSKSPSKSSNEVNLTNTNTETVCSDYLLQLVTDLRSQVNERDQRIKIMQAYIDQILTRILSDCPQILEK